jgi:hypothetical protein
LPVSTDFLSVRTTSSCCTTSSTVCGRYFSTHGNDALIVAALADAG